MTRFALLSKLTSAATLVVVLATAALYAIGSDSWQSAFALALVVLGVRVVVMAWAAVRRELPFSRLLLPGRARTTATSPARRHR